MTKSSTYFDAELICYLYGRAKLSPVLQDMAVMVWEELKLHVFLSGLPLPCVQPIDCAEDGIGMQFSWTLNNQHLSIDLFESRACDWFYRNRISGKIAGTNTSLRYFPREEILKHLSLIAETKAD